ncbi:MAG: transcription elongation factor GreA [Myxococcota bacterium]|nr:transcription elongation factor GreA [Myxococcota bacterium]
MERYLATPYGLSVLRNRLKAIKEVDRPQNVRDIEEARAHGDLSENAEYHAAKERQGLLDAELRVLEDKISRADVIDPSKLSGDRVVFGATVDLVNTDNDEEVTYQIVGTDEADIKVGKISYASPLGKAIIGKEEGDEIAFQAPGGTRHYEVLDVRFA